MSTCEECGRPGVEFIRERRFVFFDHDLDPVNEYWFCGSHWPDSDAGVHELMDDIKQGRYDEDNRFEMLRRNVEQRPGMFRDNPGAVDYDWMTDEEKEELLELAERILDGDSDE